MGVPLSSAPEDPLNTTPTQLSLDDLEADLADAGEDDFRPGDLQRLGETAEFRALLLDLLRLDGWDIAVVGAFAGDGVLVIARRGPFEVSRAGASVADVATDIFQEAAALRGAIGR